MDEDYTVQLRGDSRDYDQAMAGSVQQTDALTSSLGRLGQGIQSMYQKADRRLTIVAATEAASIAGVTLAAGRLEQQMSQLQARQTMLQQGSNAYLGTVNNLRQSYGLTSESVIGLVSQLNRLNVPLQQQQATISTYVKLAATTGESIQGLAQSNSMFMQQMQAAPRTVENYASMFSQLNARMGASAQSTIDFSNSIAPLSSTLGLNAQQIAGISAAFAKSGQDGYAAANVYTKILSDVNRAIQYGSPEVQVYSDLLGKTVDQFKAMPKAEVVTDIFEQLNKQGPQAIKTLERLGLEGVRSQRAIQAVVQTGDLRKAIGIAQGGYSNTGGFESASQKALSGLNDELSKSSETLKTFSQTVGSVFLPAANVMAQGFNIILGPLRLFSSIWEGLPGPLRTVASTIAAIGGPLAVLVPLLPKLAAGLAATSFLPMLTRGPLAQGFLLGRNPNRRLSEANLSYMAGEGNAGQRGLHGVGMHIGDMMNWGSRGTLGQHQFLDPNTGEMRDVRSWTERLGMLPGRVGQAAQDQLNPERRLGGTGRFGSSALGGAIGFTGSLIRSQLRPWDERYQKDSVGFPDPNAITQRARFRDTSIGQSFTQEGFTRNLKGIQDSFGRMTGRIEDTTKAFDANGKEVKAHASVLRRIGQELGSTALYTGRAAMGAGAGAGALAQRGLRAGAGAIGSFLGGPVGVGLGAAAVGLGIYENNTSKMRSLFEGDQQDHSAGSDYRNALGIASKATTTFADVVSDNASRMNTVVSTVQDALQVTATDITRATGQTNKIVDQNLQTMTQQQAGVYASQVLAGAGPQEAQSLKYDLIARFGGAAAQRILNQGTTGTNANLFNLMSNDTQKLFGTPIVNDITMTDRTRAAGQMVASTAQTQLNQAQQSGGFAGTSRMQQSLINQFIGSTRDYARQFSLSGDQATAMNVMSGGSQLTKARMGALFQALGIQDDEPSRRALQNVLNNVSTKDMSPADTDRVIQEALTGNLGGTALGSLLQTARGAGGLYSGQSYSTAGESSTSLNVLDPMALESIRGVRRNDQGGITNYGAYGRGPGGTLGNFNGVVGGTSLVGQIASSYAYGGAAGTVGRALNNEGNADYQAMAARDLLNRTTAATGGDTQATVQAMVEFRNSVGTANPALIALADAALAAAQAQRSFAMSMQGQTTFVDTARTAMQDFAGAVSSARANPNAPGAFQRTEAAQESAQGALQAGKDRMTNVAMQYRQLDIQRRQGEQQLNIQQGYALEDFNRQRNQAETDFYRQRGRAEDNFERQQGRALHDYQLSRERGEHDYQLQRLRGTEDFNRQQGRAQHDFDLQRRRATSDFNRQRLRQEEDYNHSVQLMAEQTAKSVYDTYTRVTVQRTYSGTNLLSNLEDQNQRLVEQRRNLGQARQLGLSNRAIQQLGLNDSQNAQQLARLVQDMMNDPALVKQYNSAIKNRVSDATALMKDQSNLQWTEMQRQQRLGLARSRDDFNLAMDRQREDFHTSFDRQREDFNRSLSRGASDFNTTVNRQRRDFNTAVTRNRRDFGIQLSQAATDFNIMRDRQQEQMTLSFERQRKDFARQMRINAENISTFAQDIGMSFETAFKTVHSRVSGETKKQFEALKQLYDAYNKTIDVKNKLLESTINKPYEALNQFKPFRLVKGGPMLSMGGPGDNSDVAHANALGGGTGGGTGNPESGGAHKYDPLHGALHINTPYGKRGSWAAGYHTGVDLRAREGTAVYAAEPGKVVYAGWGGAYGNLTKIAHGDGIQTWYAHQSHIGVRRGETVDGGEKIGNVGHTGRVFPAGPGGAHLHFELRVNGRDRDPMPWLRGASSPSGSKGSPSDAPGSAEMPNWLGMEGVKQWNSFLGDLGVMDRGSLSKYTISNMASNAYAAAYQLAYPGGAPAGAEGDPLTGGSARNNWGSGTGHITPGGKSSAYARRAASILGPKFGFNTVGTYPGHDPTEALALDFMLDKPYSADGKAQGEAAWNYVQKNWRQLGLDYMIFWTKIWNPPGGLRGGRDGSSPVDHDHARHYSGTPNPHKDHVHLSFMPGHAAGVNGATPGWAVVGENGPEYIRMRGGEQVASRTNAKAAIQASNAQQVVSASGVTNNTWDHSVHYEGQMVVMAQDPNELGRKLAEKQRLSALVTARK